jgi:hypothetical protein
VFSAGFGPEVSVLWAWVLTVLTVLKSAWSNQCPISIVVMQLSSDYWEEIVRSHEIEYQVFGDDLSTSFEK